jgi:uncharacterized protein (UPF0305 family)
MTLLVHIEKKYGVPAKAVISSLLVIIIIGIGSFVWMNISFPKDQKQIDSINTQMRETVNSINVIERQGVNTANQVEIIKANAITVIDKVNDINKHQDNIEKLLYELVLAKRSSLRINGVTCK